MATITAQTTIPSEYNEKRFRDGLILSFSLNQTIPSGSTITSIEISIPVWWGTNGTCTVTNNHFDFYSKNGESSSVTLDGVSVVYSQSDLTASGIFPKGDAWTKAVITSSIQKKDIPNSISSVRLEVYGQYVGFNTPVCLYSGNKVNLTITYAPPSSGGDGGYDYDGEIDYTPTYPTYTPSYSSPSLSISSSPSNGWWALSSGTNTSFVLTASANSGTISKVTCSDSSISISGSTGVSYGDYTVSGSFIGGQIYTFVATNSYSYSSQTVSIKFEKIPKLTATISYNSSTLKDSSSSNNEYPLCKQLLQLKGVAKLDEVNTTNGITNEWGYSYGSSVGGMTEDYKKFSGENGSTISTLDIVEKTAGTSYPVAAGDYYQISYTATYTHTSGIKQTATALLDTFRYPKNFQTITGLNIGTVYNGNISSNIGDSGYFNNNCYFSIEYPQLEDGYSGISQVSILLANSETASFSTYAPIQTYSYSQVPANFTIDLDAAAVPRGNNISIGIRLINKLDQSVEFYKIKNEGSNVNFNRINLPYFGSKEISSSANSIITLNYNPSLSSGNSNLLRLAIPVPYSYNTIASNLTGSIIAERLEKIYLRVSNTNAQYNFTLSNLENSVTYNVAAATGYIYITLNELKEKFTNFLSQNTTVEFKVSLAFKDDFGNECNQTFSINHNNEVSNDVLTFNFGAPPVMAPYNSSSYFLKVQYGDAEPSLITSGAMINQGDLLSISFPKASDANGDDDIQSYRIKIYRSDSDLSTYAEGDNVYQVLASIPRTEFSALYADGVYTYKHTVNNYVVSKFIKLAVSALDSSGLESNLVEYPFMLVAGRISASTSNIRSYQFNENIVNFVLSVSDIGGNKFNNQNISYLDYPNLERQYPSGVSRSIKIDLQHRDSESIAEYRTIAEGISFKVGNLAASNNYTGAYSTVLTNYISIDNLDLSDITPTINPSVKNYYRFIIRVQVGFNDDIPIYQTGYSSEYITYPSTPTVAYRKNCIGLNTESLKNYDDAVLVAAAGVDSRKSFYFIYEDHQSIVNIETGEIDGFIIDCGEW